MKLIVKEDSEHSVSVYTLKGDAIALDFSRYSVVDTFYIIVYIIVLVGSVEDTFNRIALVGIVLWIRLSIGLMVRVIQATIPNAVPFNTVT